MTCRGLKNLYVLSRELSYVLLLPAGAFGLVCRAMTLSACENGWTSLADGRVVPRNCVNCIVVMCFSPHSSLVVIIININDDLQVQVFNTIINI